MAASAATRTRALRPLLHAAFFLACLQLLLAPALTSAGRLLLAEGGGDGYQNLWNFWWLERALDEGRSPWHTTLLHHPFGISLQGHTLGLVNFALAHPLLRAGVDRVVAYNVVLVLSFVLTGVTGAWLVHRITGGARAALVGGFLITFSHWRLTHGVGHLNLIGAEALPLLLLAALRLLERPSLVAGAAAGAATLLVGLSDLYLLTFGGLVVLVLLADRVAREGAPWLARRDTVRGLGVFALLGGAVAVGLGLPLVLAARRDPFMFPTDPAAFSAELPAFFLPGSGARLGALTRGYWSRLVNPFEGDVYLGLPALVLAALGWWRRDDLGPRVAAALRPWAVVAVAGVVLGLGPALQLAGKQVGPAILPWRLLGELPPLSLSGKPCRVAFLATLGVAVLAAAGLRLVERRHGRRAALAALALLVVDALPRAWPTDAARPSPWVQALADAPPGAVLDVASGLYQPLLDQTQHGRPIAFGYVSRYPRSVIEREAPLIAAHQAEDLAALRDRFRLRYVVTPPGVDWRDRPGVRLLHDDPSARLWDLGAPR